MVGRDVLGIVHININMQIDMVCLAQEPLQEWLESALHTFRAKVFNAQSCDGRVRQVLDLPRVEAAPSICAAAASGIGA